MMKNQTIIISFEYNRNKITFVISRLNSKGSFTTDFDIIQTSSSSTLPLVGPHSDKVN